MYVCVCVSLTGDLYSGHVAGCVYVCVCFPRQGLYLYMCFPDRRPVLVPCIILFTPPEKVVTETEFHRLESHSWSRFDAYQQRIMT